MLGLIGTDNRRGIVRELKRRRLTGIGILGGRSVVNELRQVCDAPKVLGCKQF